MICLGSFSSRSALVLLLAATLAAGCAAQRGVSGTASNLPLIAVLPLENLSAAPVPLREVREGYIEELKKAGFQVLPDSVLEDFMERNIVRYTAGMDETTAKVMKEETGADAAVMTSVELYSDAPPPKVSLSSRLVAMGTPDILWAGGEGMCGDDHPGLFGFGVITDQKTLVRRALAGLSRSMAQKIEGQGRVHGKGEKGRGLFGPRAE